MEAVYVMLMLSIGVLHAHAAGTPGTIVITWNIVAMRRASQYIHVQIQNNFEMITGGDNQWRIGWTWVGDEFIRKATGARALNYGTCGERLDKGKSIHSCAKSPRLIDLLPTAPYDLQTQNCCKGGNLPVGGTAEFRMSIESQDNSSLPVPQNFSIGLRGFKCECPIRIAPTEYQLDNTSYFASASWEVACRYEPEGKALPVDLVCKVLFWVSLILGLILIGLYRRHRWDWGDVVEFLGWAFGDGAELLGWVLGEMVDF